MALKVVPFPSATGISLADALRVFADDIDAGDYGEPSTILAVVETPDSIYTVSFGKAYDRMRNAGLLTMAKIAHLEAAFE